MFWLYSLFFIIFFLKIQERTNTYLTLLSPITFFYVWSVIFYWVPIQLDIAWTSGFLSETSIRGADENAVIRLLFLSLLTIGISSLFKRKPIKERTLKETKGLSVYLTISLWLFFIILLSRELVLSFVKRDDMALAVMNLRNGSSIKFFIIASSEFLIYFLMVYTGRIRVNLKNLALFAVVAIVIASVGARSLLVSFAISLLVSLYYLKRYSIRLMIIIGFLGLGFFLITSLTRSNNADLIQYLQNNLELYTNTVNVIHKIDNGEVNYQYGGTLIDALYMPIPTSIWQNKPRSYAPSRLIYPEMISRGVREGTRFTVNFGLIGRGYLEGGNIGVVISCLLYSLIFNGIFNLLYSRGISSRLKLAFLIFIYGHIFQVLILGITSHVYTMYTISFSFMLVLHIINQFLLTWKKY